MRFISILLSVFYLISCSSTQYYMIPMGETAVFKNTDNLRSIQKNNYSYAIRYLTLPDYLNDQYLIYYDGKGKVNRDAKRLWNANLEDNIRNNLQQQLSANGLSNLYTYPLPTHLKVNQIIDIQIPEMIANAEEKKFYINANWQLTNSVDQTQTSHHFTQIYTLPDIQADTLIKLYQQSLTELGNAIYSSLLH